MLDNLRRAMKNAGVNAYLIFNTDPHQSEYIPEDFMTAKALTGFTGDNATLVVTQDFAGLWTDSRFFISGEIEIKDSGFQLMKRTQEPETSYLHFLKTNLKEGDQVACNGELISASEFSDLKRKLQPYNILVNDKIDLTDQFWQNRPQIKFSKIFILEDKYAGKDVRTKLEELSAKLKENNVDCFLTSGLDDIAWILNLRGSDIAYCPVFRAYFMALQNGKSMLFIHKQRLTPEISKYLQRLDVMVMDYDSIASTLENLPNKYSIMLDSNVLNSKLYSSINSKCKIVDRRSPIQFAKSEKNIVELQNMYKSMLEDGLALERFFYKFEQNLENDVPMTELSAASMLLNERKKSKYFLYESFECISAFNHHAAMPHYAPSEKDDIPIEKDGVYLVDSGGQYYLGTTDVTRTIPTGKFPENFARDYTLVLISNLNIAMQQFPEGTPGSRLDTLARCELWKYGLDFGHGTGHGVGYCLNCHEGPQAFSTSSSKNNKIPLVKGMVITDEPGLYIEGKYGIRTENMMDVDKSGTDGFLKFNIMTLCHIDTRPVIKEMMTPSQIDYLNAYNQSVYDTLSPYLESEVNEYLKQRTQKI